MSPDEANRTSSLVYIISTFGSLIFGLIVDKKGNILGWILAALISMLGAYVLLAFTTLTPYIGMSFLGFGYSICSVSIWSVVAMLVPEHQLGTAFGM